MASFSVLNNYLNKLKSLSDAKDTFLTLSSQIRTAAKETPDESRERPLIDAALADRFAASAFELSNLENEAHYKASGFQGKAQKSKKLGKFAKDVYNGKVDFSDIDKIESYASKKFTQSQREDIERTVKNVSFSAPLIGKLSVMDKRLIEAAYSAKDVMEAFEVLENKRDEGKAHYAFKMGRGQREEQKEEEADAPAPAPAPEPIESTPRATASEEVATPRTEPAEALRKRAVQTMERAYRAERERQQMTREDVTARPARKPSEEFFTPREAPEPDSPPDPEKTKELLETIEMIREDVPAPRISTAADPGESTSAERIAETAANTRQEIIVPAPAPHPQATTLEPVHEAANPINDETGATVSAGEARAAAQGLVDNDEAARAHHRHKITEASARAEVNEQRRREAMDREAASEQTHTQPIGPEARLREQEQGQDDYDYYVSQVEAAATSASADEQARGFQVPQPIQSGYTEFSISGAPRSRSSTETSEESINAAARARQTPVVPQRAAGPAPIEPPQGQKAVRDPASEPQLAEGRFELEDVTRGYDDAVSGTPAQIMQQPGAPDAKSDEEQVKGLSIEQAKDKIRALHTVYNSEIPAFREKAHTKAKDDALQSSDKKVVHAHLLDMLKTVRNFYSTGKGAGLQVGVIIPASQVIAALRGGGGGGGGGGMASGPAVAAAAPASGGVMSAFSAPEKEHPGSVLHREGEDRFGHAIALGIHRTSSGMAAYQRRGVRGHEVKNKMKVAPGPVSNPIIRMNQNCPENFRLGPVLGRRAPNLGIKIKT